MKIIPKKTLLTITLILIAMISKEIQIINFSHPVL